MEFTCFNCQATVKADDALAGKLGKCPACATVMLIPHPSSANSQVEPKDEGALKNQPENVSSILPKRRHDGRLATERQKEFAKKLSVEFSDDICGSDMSDLLDKAIAKRNEERSRNLDDLSDRESKAYREMYDLVYQQVLEQVTQEDEFDPRVSKATPKQMVQALANRDQGAILITFDIAQTDFDNLAGVPFSLSFSDNMDESDMKQVLIGLGVITMHREGKRRG